MKISRTSSRAPGVPRRPRRGARLRREAPALEWARDASGACARVTAVGSHSLLVENHTGVLDFTRERVQLNTRCGPLCVLGSGLELRDVRRGVLVVHGSVSRVELPCEGGDGADEG